MQGDTIISFNDCKMFAKNFGSGGLKDYPNNVSPSKEAKLRMLLRF